MRIVAAVLSALLVLAVATPSGAATRS